jgi:biopolymer transport protein ExbD
MRIRSSPSDDAPDINFIPLIDVLLVIVIFLAVSTSFTQERALEILLPQSQAESALPQTIEIVIAADGRIAIDHQLLEEVTIDRLRDLLIATARQSEASVVVIRADANATHQSVITAMQAARLAGIEKISFAAQVGN